MRIDKYLANLGLLSRKDSKKEIKNKNIFINKVLVKKEDEKLKFGDKIICLGKEIIYRENIFVILNKKENFVCSKVPEANYKSIYDLLQDCDYKNILEIAGRLDADTTGLVLFTNNGEILHKLIHPKKNIFKKYYVKAEKNISKEEIGKLESGVIIDGNYLTKPAKVEILSENEINLSIQEGKFHQIKKMLEAIGNKVEKLHRIEIGEIKLGNLEIGKWRFLNEDEIAFLENL